MYIYIYELAFKIIVYLCVHLLLKIDLYCRRQQLNYVFTERERETQRNEYFIIIIINFNEL